MIVGILCTPKEESAPSGHVRIYHESSASDACLVTAMMRARSTKAGQMQEASFQSCKLLSRRTRQQATTPSPPPPAKKKKKSDREYHRISDERAKKQRGSRMDQAGL